MCWNDKRGLIRTSCSRGLPGACSSLRLYVCIFALISCFGIAANSVQSYCKMTKRFSGQYVANQAERCLSLDVLHLQSVQTSLGRDIAIAKQALRQAAKSMLVIAGGSCFSSTLPALLILASSALSSAPTSMAKPVQYNQTINAIAAPSVP
jgi:hypothetical protein